MRVQIRLFFLVTISHLLIPSTWAAPSRLDAFCTDAYQETCKSFSTWDADNKRYLDELKQKALTKLKATSKWLQPQYAPLLRLIEVNELRIEITERQVPLMFEVQRAYLEALISLLPFKKSDFLSYLDTIRKAESWAIDIHPKFKESSLKTEMKNKFWETQPLFLNEYFDYSNSFNLAEDERKKVMIQDLIYYFESCNTDGMRMAANALGGTLSTKGYDESFQFVRFCPATIILAGRYFPKWTYFQEIGHEYAHYIDSDHFNSAYSEFSSCVNTIKPSHEPSGTLREMIPDVWSAETLAVLINSGLVSDPLEATMNSVREYCDQKGSNKHASGQFRIRELIGKNPRLRAALGCPKPRVKLSGCAFEGKVRF